MGKLTKGQEERPLHPNFRAHVVATIDRLRSQIAALEAVLGEFDAAEEVKRLAALEADIREIQLSDAPAPSSHGETQ